MADTDTTLTVENGVGTIVLNRAKQKNSLSGELINSLCDHLNECMTKDDVRVIVLTNAGNTFCAGANLKGGGAAARYTIVDLFKIMQNGPKVLLGSI